MTGQASTGAYIAIDWGTSNRRAFLVGGDGERLDAIRDDRGVLMLAPDDFPREIEAIRDRLGVLPVIAAGMVGSTRGWVDVPYVAAPAAIADLARGGVSPADDVRLVPGVSLVTADACDVMRGEEVQVLGALAAGLAPDGALFCQPGTHNKWIETEGHRITAFATTMTGEVFALLRGHGILAGMLDGAVADGPAFRDGLARGAGATDLLAALFGVRAQVLLGRRPAADAAAYASGILIGADVGARTDIDGRDVHLLGSGPLATLYAAAIATRGGRPLPLDAEAAFVAGIHAIRSFSA